MLKTQSKVKFGAIDDPAIKEKYGITRDFEVVLFNN